MSAPDAFWMIHGVVRECASCPASAPPHSRVAFGDLCVLLSQGHASEPSGPQDAAAISDELLKREAAAALDHNAILTAYAVVGDVAPVRFGAAVSDPEAAVALLEPAATHYAQVLDRVSGAVEYALRLHLSGETRNVPEAKTEEALTGRAYLEAQRGRRDARDTQATRLNGFISTLAHDIASHARETEAMPARPGRLLDLALLIPHGEVDALIASAATWSHQAALHGLELSLVGPWPPYSFTQTASGPSDRQDLR